MIVQEMVKALQESNPEAYIVYNGSFKGRDYLFTLGYLDKEVPIKIIKQRDKFLFKRVDLRAIL